MYVFSRLDEKLYTNKTPTQAFTPPASNEILFGLERTTLLIRI